MKGDAKTGTGNMGKNLIQNNVPLLDIEPNINPEFFSAYL